MERNNGNKSGAGMSPMTTNMGSSEMLGLEMSLHQAHHPLSQQLQHNHLSPFSAQRHEAAAALDHSHSPQQQQQLGHASYVNYSVGGSTKRRQQPLSALPLTSQDLQVPTSFGGKCDGGTATDTATAAIPVSAAEGARHFSQSLSPSPSPWHRMKWTDSMVRLLIMIVFCVGDDATAGNTTADQGDQHSASSGNRGKKAPMTSSTSSSAAGLVLQKKGKWKSVSRAMMEKGFYVSPQQCEDKFNDLNKRYKRVNELLGKGTACRVVENQALLDSMDHLSSKAKEEARKLLNSKHLFFREMCAYHNGGGGGGCDGAVPAASPTSALSQPPQPQSSPLASIHHTRSQSQNQHCFHHLLSSMSFSKEALFVEKGGHSTGSMFGGVNEEDDEGKDQTDNNDYYDTGDDDEEVEEEDEDYDDDDEEEEANKEGFEDNKSRHHQHQKKHKDEKNKASKLTRPTSPLSASPPLSLSLSSSPPLPMDQLRCNLLGSLASMGGEQQQRQWLKRKAAELEEQRFGYQYRALELERQRFKWLRYSSNKEREMERIKLNHERRCLENDRMLLLLRQKEQELIINTNATTVDQHLHHQKLLH